MNRKRLFLLATCLLLAAVLLQAAIPDMKFRRLDARDGLSSSQVNCIFRDSRGLVWIGTPFGLNRYDGYRVKTYYSHTSDTTTMPNNYVNDVTEAADGCLWVRNGVKYSVFNPTTEVFDRHPELWLHRMGVKGAIERVFIDRHKHFWVKTYDQGFWWLDPEEQQVRQFVFGHGPQQFDADMGISDMTEYGNSLVVISNNGDMVCFNTKQVHISWKSHTLRRISAERNKGYHLTVDAQHNLWVLAEGRGYVFLRKAGRWVRSVSEALRYFGVEGLPVDTKIWDLDVDKHQQLWLATDHQGLCVVNLKEQTLRQFLNVKNDETSISDNTLGHIYRDQQDRMWIATYMNGVNYYAEHPSRFRHIAAGNINTICVDREGYYWLGSDDKGIIRYDSKTGAQTVFDKTSSGLGSNVIVSSLAATDGVLWFGSYEGGLAAYRDGQFRSYRVGAKGDGLAHNSVWALEEDPWGNIWVGTLGAGLQRIDRKTGVFTTLDTKSGLASNYISSIQLTRDGWLLVGHTEFYSLVNPRTMEIQNCRIEDRNNDLSLMPASHQVMEDSRSLVWQCAPSGVTVVEKGDGRNKGNAVCYHLDAESGLYGAAVGIVEDHDKAIWVITQNGMSRVVPQQQDGGGWTFLVRSFNNRDGLQDAPFNQRSAIMTPDGKILVGGHDGVDIVEVRGEVSDERGKMSGEVPMISGVKVMDGAAHPVERRLELAYDERHFTLQLASNSGEVHNRSRFAYRLLGLNSKWVYTEETNPNAIYTGLPSGSYTFCVRMLNDDGTLGDNECRLDVTVSPPWYRSWWMWLVYLALAAAAVYGGWRRYREKLRLERMKLEQENSHKLDEQRQRFYDTVSDELRQPFLDTFESLNAMMQRETDEQRYELQQRVFGHVEHLLSQVNTVVEGNHGHDMLKPQIREVEITNLDEKLVREATDYVEHNLSNSDISVETMAEALGMSRVHLYKRLTAVSGLTPSEFIRQIRLRHAEQLLLKSGMTVAEVAYKVGFSNPRYFSKYFREMYGTIPSEYKNSVS